MKRWRLIALVPLGLDAGHDPFDATPACVTVARPRGLSVEALVIGTRPGDAQSDRALACGADSVTLFSHGSLPEAPTVAQWTVAAASALSRAGVTAASNALVLLPPAPEAEEAGARLAVRFDAQALGRCTSLDLQDGRIAATRSAFGTRAQVTVAGGGNLSFASLRTRAPEGATPSGTPADRVALDVAIPPAPVIETVVAPGRPKPLEGARLVVCGGRGMGGEEGMTQLAQLADRLGGVLAGSLPAVDAGWVSVAQQVGQSGRYVTPEIYLGVGVSGTPQHLAGIGPGTRVLALNSDPNADIFRVAEAGLVADWRDALPALLDRLDPAP